MLGVLLAALAAPQPSPTPLKTIVKVRSTPFCTTFREVVGQSVKAMIQNNAAIGDAKALLLMMAHDKVSRASPNAVIDMDIQRLGPFIDVISRNLAAVQAQLGDSTRFPAHPRNEDERRLADMQKALRAIAQRQNQALNILSGTYFSYNGNRLMGHGDGMKAPVDPPDDASHEAPIVLPPMRPLPDSASLSNAWASPSPNATPAAIDLGLMGETKFAALFNSLTTYQVQEQPLEAQAAKVILQSAPECRGETP